MGLPFDFLAFDGFRGRRLEAKLIVGDVAVRYRIFTIQAQPVGKEVSKLEGEGGDNKWHPANEQGA